MRIVFMGTPDIAASCLEALYAAGHDICAVYTRRDKPVGRKQVLTPPPVKQVALAHGTPVFQPRTLRDGGENANLQALAPDLIVVVAYGCILPQAVLDIPKFGCINLHVSLLPKYRGSAPVQWAVLNGDAETGVSIQQMDAGLDTGDVLVCEKVAIGPEDYICIMTRGHAYDTIVQAQALRTPACYIGVIGSKAKTAGVQRQLRTMGFTDEDFARITTPIGLDIKAETPAEIAISIAAQMIEVRAGRNAL